MPEKIHIVKQGETVASIAKKYGFTNWRIIYDHQSNVEFRQKRKDPNILYPGDRVVIPEKEIKEKTGGTDQKHTFQFKGTKQYLRIIVKDQNNKPLKNIDYTLYIGSVSFKGTTDHNGLLKQEISQDTSIGFLSISGFELPLMIGHLDPVEEVSGWQARLKNLGYNPVPIDGKTKDDGNERLQLKAAVEEFQFDNNLKIDGIVGPKTKMKLTKIHGC
jgi:N-acetylmuramoyl-L-alanine amidase